MIDELQEIAWHSPVEAAQSLATQATDFALLFSAKQTSYSGEYSYLAWGVVDELTADDINALTQINEATTLPHWFGYITYEANHANFGFDVAKNTPPQNGVNFVKYANVVQYNHITEKCYYHGSEPVEAILKSLSNDVAKSHISFPQTFPKAKNITPYFLREQYHQHINDAIAQIHAGNFYQANLTCKYSGELEEKINHISAFAGFTELCTTSPAPYSAFIAQGGTYIISASPELFVKIDANNNITTRPIKGTAPITETATSLRLSEKNMAENLMIVDLMRNDFSQVAINGTLSVPHLWEIDSFKNLHHLSSTISAMLQHNFQLGDVISKIFPAGSMTGAPKIAAMKWLNIIEGAPRGIYSGALGWINGNNCELSVVIRTLITNDTQFECQFGGGITTDSEAESEYQEMLTKANGVFSLLKVAI